MCRIEIFLFMATGAIYSLLMKHAAGTGFSIVLAVVLALVGLEGRACATRSRHATAPFLLEVPAEHMSVGQQFAPRLVSRTAITGSPMVRIELLDASGHRVWQGSAPLPPPGQPTVLSTIAMPHEGSYRLVATGEEGEIRHDSVSVGIEAVPEPPSLYGHVQAMSALGLSDGVIDYLRAHAFAVSQGIGQDTPPIDAPPIIVVGDPRLTGDLNAAYASLWQHVANGSNLLLLNPPTPQLATDWPFTTRLVPAQGCGDDFFPPSLTHLKDGSISPAMALPAIRPAVAYDLSGETRIVAESFDGHFLPRISGQSGFSGCHAIFSFRFGRGWVTVSTLPLLQHFNDTWDRVYLMNLIATAARKVKGYPAGGLADVQASRLKQASTVQKQVPVLPAATWYEAPQPIPSAPWPAPRAIDGADGSCFTTPTAGQRIGQTLVVDLNRPVALSSVRIKMGLQGSQPSAFVVEGSPDGWHWTKFGDASTLDAQGNADYPVNGQTVREIRLRVTASLDHHPWSVCEVTPELQASTPGTAAASARPAR